MGDLQPSLHFKTMSSGDLCQRQDLRTAFDSFFCVGVVGMSDLAGKCRNRLTPRLFSS